VFLIILNTTLIKGERGSGRLMEKVKIDSIDAKLISLLLKDARTKTKDLAQVCGISSTAVGNRLAKLKSKGVITGSALVVSMSEIGYMFPASISIESIKQEDSKKIISFIEKSSGIFYFSFSFGKYDMQIFLISRTTNDIQNLKKLIMNRMHCRISVDLWETLFPNFENIMIDGALNG
jgi:Lrp/AsnC family transcriptional regulator, regulator for asnA, asnC and gidA